ncbi:peptidoglycan-binding protein, partial [uncultured Maricaulis sp.]
MASPRFARFQEADNGDHWPGFVDALATLLLVIVFLLSIFVAGQFALSRALTGRDEQLAALNAQLAQLADELALTQEENTELELRVSGLETERDALSSALAMAGTQTASLQAELDAERELSEESQRALMMLNLQIQALRDQIATLNAALDASELRAQEAEAQVINLGERLNAALAERAAELAVYRSDFFGRLRAILGNRTGVRIVGDRFVFETDVLFPSGSAALSNEGRESLRPIA